MKGLKWIVFLLGLWVLVSPWILGFSTYTLAMWSNVVAGVLIIIIALWKIFGEKPPMAQ